MAGRLRTGELMTHPFEILIVSGLGANRSMLVVSGSHWCWNFEASTASCTFIP